MWTTKKIIFFWSFICFSSFLIPQSATSLHKEIADSLIAMRKDQPAIQEKIYSVLDKLTQLTNLHSQVVEENKKLSETLEKAQEQQNMLHHLLEKKTEEVAALSEQVSTLKRQYNDLYEHSALEKKRAALTNFAKQSFGEDKNSTALLSEEDEKGG